MKNKFHILAYKNKGTIFYIGLTKDDPIEKFKRELAEAQWGVRSPLHQAMVDAGKNLKLEVLFETEDHDLAYLCRNCQLYIYKKTVTFKGHHITKQNFAIGINQLNKAIEDGLITKLEKQEEQIDIPDIVVDEEYPLSPMQAKLVKSKIYENMTHYASLNAEYEFYLAKTDEIDNMEFELFEFSAANAEYLDVETVKRHGRQAIKQKFEDKLTGIGKMLFKYKSSLDFWCDKQRVFEYLNKSKP